jgi:hypothetical protein
MSRYWLIVAAAFAVSANIAAAQSVPFDATNSAQPTMSTNGPAGTIVVKKTETTRDASGQDTVTSQSFAKSQSYSSGDGALTAHTVIRTTGPVTTTKPVPLIPLKPQETLK